MKILMLLLLLLHPSIVEFVSSNEENVDAQDSQNQAELTDATTSPPPGQGGRSFFLFGGFFRKFRARWHGQNDPVPLYAGPAFPLTGYYNCPVYGCDPTMNYRPAPYEPTNYYHRTPYPYNPMPPYPSPAQQQAQQHHQQSNVVIYQNGQQHQGQPAYYPQNYPLHQGPPPIPIPQRMPVQNPYQPNAVGGAYYPPPPPPPVPQQYGGLQAAPNYPNTNGVAVVYHQNSPQYPIDSYGNYNNQVPPPLPPPLQPNYDPLYNPRLPPLHNDGTFDGPVPMPPPPLNGLPTCPPHIYPCHAGG